MIGNIHSIETFGTLDGPGIRMVVFTQGCPMRCLYCHNPDTWNLDINKQISSDEIIEKYLSVKEFCKGGITLTGGEPLLQIDFVIDLFKKARAKNIHTTLDTSGITFTPNNKEKFEELIKYTSLVMLDIKHIDEKEHIKLTGKSNKNILEFAKFLSENNVTTWIRHVVVPTITDKEEYLSRLGEFLATLKNVKALDVLPYHDMAKTKYEKLNIDYKLKDIEPLDKKEALRARNIIIKAMKNAKPEQTNLC